MCKVGDVAHTIGCEALPILAADSSMMMILGTGSNDGFIGLPSAPAGGRPGPCRRTDSESSCMTCTSLSSNTTTGSSHITMPDDHHDSRHHRGHHVVHYYRTRDEIRRNAKALGLMVAADSDRIVDVAMVQSEPTLPMVADDLTIPRDSGISAVTASSNRAGPVASDASGMGASPLTTRRRESVEYFIRSAGFHTPSAINLS